MEITSLLEIGEWAWKQIKPRKILLAVEDDSDDQRLLRDELEAARFRYEIASTGEESLGLLCKTNFSAALIDIGLPGISGLTLASKIRDNYPKTRVFFVTGGSFINLTESQIICIIRKPVTAAVLREMII